MGKGNNSHTFLYWRAPYLVSLFLQRRF